MVNPKQNSKTTGKSLPLWQSLNVELKEKDVQKLASEQDWDYVDLKIYPLERDALMLLKKKEVLDTKSLLYFVNGKVLKLASTDPSNQATQTLIASLQKRGYRVSLSLMSEESFQFAWDVYQKWNTEKENELTKTLKQTSAQTFEKEIQNLEELKSKLQTAVGEEILELLNLGALRTGASDIHIDPQAQNVLLRFRIDGLLYEIFRLDLEKYQHLAQQIKYRSNLKANLTSLPQDGHYEFDFQAHKVSVRVATFPTNFGESFVLRFVDKGKTLFGFEELGFQEFLQQKIQTALLRHRGMLLVTGPTGSGKTTTLYALLQKLNNSHSKIVTLENPIEYQLPGLIQSQIDPAHGYDFQTGVRSILRQDPDVLMVGEIRDQETAEIAFQAALTGDLVFSSLHTGRAQEAIPRLFNLGLRPFMLAPGLNAIIAQRLVRKVCPECHLTHTLSATEQQEFQATLTTIKEIMPKIKPLPNLIYQAKPEGCEKCSHTGYRGRTVIGEVLLITEAIRELILKRASADAIFKQARTEGFLTLEEDGLLKVLAGITTLEEVERVK